MSHFFTTQRTRPIKILLLGAGELGKEVAIEAQRLGCQVVAADRYAGAPAMQVANAAHVLDMLDAHALRSLVETERPDLIVPEIEAIATDELVALETEGFHVAPSARAARLTMDREGIRRLAAEELGLPTSRYRFVDEKETFRRAIKELGLPCVVKPIMSSSGKGQSLVRNEEDIDKAWEYAQTGGRGGAGRVIVESFIKFDFEITLLTIRHINGTSFCEPIGHTQVNGDYQESWQPQSLTDVSLARARDIAKKITEALGGHGLFGVELFVKGDDVVFSEVSPRPHDTGLVTLVSQNLSEFALHVRAILGLPIPKIVAYGPAASHVLIAEGQGKNPTFSGLREALRAAETDVRLFGKPEVNGKRRVGVCLARDHSTNAARKKARAMVEAIQIKLN